MKDKLFTFLVLATIISCTSQSLEDIQPDCSTNPIIINVSIENSDCGADNGIASVTLSGGTAPYSYNLGGTIQNEGNFTGLAPGSYSITITDANNCSETLEFAVENKVGTFATATSTLAGCGTSFASITVEASNGEQPYSYSLNGGTPQASNVFEAIGAGLQRVVVTDANGCEFTLDHKVSAGTSYSTEVETIIMNNCAVSGCHSGTQPPNFTIFSNVQSNSGNIKTRTQNGSMPPGGRSLTQNQIDVIACWVDDGAKDN